MLLNFLLLITNSLEQITSGKIMNSVFSNTRSEEGKPIILFFTYVSTEIFPIPFETSLHGTEKARAPSGSNIILCSMG